MPIVIPDLSGISEGIRGAGGALAGALEKKAEQRLMQQQRSALDAALQQSDFSTPAGQQDFISKYTKAGGDVKDALSIIKQQEVDPIKEWLQNRLKGGQQPPGGGAPTTPPTGGLDQTLGSMPDDMILAAASSSDPSIRAIGTSLGQMKTQELKRQTQQTKEWMQEREFHIKKSDKEADRINSMRFMVPRKTTSFQMAKNAIESGDIGSFSPAHLGEAMGIKALQTASGAQLVTAGKEHLIPNLARLSARAQNQWLQRLFNSMFPEIGKSEFANLMALTMLEEENFIDQKEIEVFDELARQDESETVIPGKSGYAKRDIDRRLDDSMKPHREEMLNRLSYRTREIWEREKGIENLVNKKAPRGTPLTLQMMDALVRREMKKTGEATPSKETKRKARELAKKLNYTIPTKDAYMRYSQ